MRAKTCALTIGERYGLNWRILNKNTLQRLPSKRKALSILNLRRPPMRSTTRQRLALCGRLSTTTLAPRGEQDAFLDWLAAKRFVVGGKVSSRVELRASRAALKRQIAAADDPEIVFLSSELQPLLVDATGLASLQQRGLAVDVEAAPAPGQPARVLRLSRPDRQERGE